VGGAEDSMGVEVEVPAIPEAGIRNTPHPDAAQW